MTDQPSAGQSYKELMSNYRQAFSPEEGDGGLGMIIREIEGDIKDGHVMTAGTKLSAAMPLIEAAGASALPLLLGYLGRLVHSADLSRADAMGLMKRATDAYEPGKNFGDTMKPFLECFGTTEREGPGS